MPTPPTEYRYPCENCGASLKFAPGQTVLTCDYCGHVQQISAGAGRAPARQTSGGVDGDRTLLEIPQTGRALQWDAQHKADLSEIPLERGLGLDAGSDLAESVRTVSCPNCGAKIEVSTGQHATDCPFCATPVVTDTGQTRLIKPQGVLPFVLTEEQAKAALDDWLGRLWFAPSGLTAYARRGRRMRGIYSPFWTFDASTASSYAGMRGDYHYETRYVTTQVNGQRRQVPQQIRHVRWSRRQGRVSRGFNDVLIMAATSLPRRFTDALTPWDLSHLEPYDPQYVVGFEAEGYTVPLADGHRIARQEMAAVIAMDVRRAIGGNEQRVEQIATDFTAETFKHILLPVWTAAYRYNGNSYRFVVNGQSGRVQGERPWSIWKIALAVVIALIALAAMLFVAQESGYVRIGTAPGGFTADGGYVIRGY